MGIGAAVDFVNAIGPERIYARIHELGAQVRDGLRAYNQIRLLNASSDGFHSGLVSFAAAKDGAGWVAPPEVSPPPGMCLRVEARTRRRRR